MPFCVYACAPVASGAISAARSGYFACSSVQRDFLLDDDRVALLEISWSFGGLISRTSFAL